MQLHDLTWQDNLALLIKTTGNGSLSRSIHFLQKSGFTLSSLRELIKYILREHHNAFSARATTSTGAYKMTGIRWWQLFTSTSLLWAISSIFSFSSHSTSTSSPSAGLKVNSTTIQLPLNKATTKVSCRIVQTASVLDNRRCESSNSLHVLWITMYGETEFPLHTIVK